MHPPQRSQVFEKFRVCEQALTLQMAGRLVHIKRVPIRDGGNHEIEGHDTLLLRLRGAIVDTPLRVGEHGFGKSMSGFAFGETCLTFHPHLGVFNPVQHEQGPFDPTDLSERGMHPVLLSIGSELAQQMRRFYGPVFDTGCHPCDFTAPMIENDVLVDRVSHNRRQVFPLTGLAEAGEASVREVAQSGHEDQAQEMKQREDMI